MMMIVTFYNHIRVGFSEEKKEERKESQVNRKLYLREYRASDLKRKKEKQKGEGEGRGTYENFACD